MAKKLESAAMHPGPGFFVRKTISRPPQDVIEQFKNFATPDLSDLMNRLYAMSPDIHSLSNGSPIAGPACTVKVFSGDNLMVHAVLDVAQPGDIVVIDTCGTMTHAVLGDLISTKARHRGIAGFVIDGMVRDLPEIQRGNMPVYARGVTPVGPLHRGPGEINNAVSCGGVVVNPGDIIRADVNGIVVIRQEYADEILRRAYEQRERLADYVEAVQRGEFNNDWPHEMLEKLNCDVEE